jgi:hypothetical protein
MTVNEANIHTRADPPIPAGGLLPEEAPTNVLALASDLIPGSSSFTTRKFRRQVQEGEEEEDELLVYEVCLAGTSRSDIARCCVNVTQA